LPPRDERQELALRRDAGRVTIAGGSSALPARVSRNASTAWLRSPIVSRRAPSTIEGRGSHRSDRAGEPREAHVL